MHNFEHVLHTFPAQNFSHDTRSLIRRITSTFARTRLGKHESIFTQCMWRDVAGDTQAIHITDPVLT
ncbi:hypothetical protein EYC80_004003 [Monilinia laxa]|uniref:Uncharacterized protein n=1 Tax=Monilinia laxa TaxID=61186 RepID=A0A5N6KLE2_MONLA|nr:hypothetical protein EYC80_004003 [Monilinia laxa]